MQIGKKKVFIITNGCPRRALDASRLEEYFRANQCRVVANPQMADYILFVTCSFKQSKEAECWNMIEKYHKYRGELIVVGCLPEIAPVKFIAQFKGRYVSTKNLERIDHLFSNFKIRFRDIPDSRNIDLHPRSSIRKAFSYRMHNRLFGKKLTKNYIINKARLIKKHLTESLCVTERHEQQKNNDMAYLRIGHGCIEQCAYCCIYRAVGKLKSKSIQDCVKEYRDILRKGHRKIVILADNPGAYGLDIQSSFGVLLMTLAEASSEEVHWVIQELHPRWVILYKNQILELVKKKKIQSLLCAIQSGSNRILTLMNRHHSIEAIKNVLLELKKVNPDLIMMTQIIAGFPSETEEDWRATINAIKEIRFDNTTFYPYYDGYDTIASKMDCKIDEATISARIKAGMQILNQEGIEVGVEADDLDV